VLFIVHDFVHLGGRSVAMTTLRERDEETAKKKGLLAGAAIAVTGVAAVAVSPVLAVVGIVPAAYLAYDWFMFRAKRGMKF
jgi:hypothetical protein